MLALVDMYHYVFLIGPTPASFSFIFGLFKQILQIFTTIICKKCPSSILCQDSNPQPLEHESPPITTRPGPRPKSVSLSLEVVLKINYNLFGL